MTPPSGLEDTPAGGVRGLIVCPKCGHAHELPPVAKPLPKAAALALPDPVLERARELEDITPTVAHPVDRRLAPTDRIERD